MSNEITFTLTISQRDLGGIRIRGGQDFEDIYLAGNDVSAVMRDLGPVIQTILSHNHGVKWLGEEASPAKSFEECARALMKANEQHDNPDHPERIKALRDYEEALHR